MHLKKILIICITAFLSGCTTPSLKNGQTLFHPEILSVPTSQRHSPPKAVEAKLNAPFQKSWETIIGVLKQSGFHIQKALRSEGEIRTSEKEFQGPSYPWRERYHIQVVENDHSTRIKVNRQVTVYRPILFLGPSVWSARISNGERETLLIEQVDQRLRTGEHPGEN